MVEAMSVIESLKETMHFDKADIEVNVAKVSIVGAGMLGSPGIAAGMFGALAKANVNIDVISTSEISVSCLVPEKDVKTAVNAIHEHFSGRKIKSKQSYLYKLRRPFTNDH